MTQKDYIKIANILRTDRLLALSAAQVYPENDMARAASLAQCVRPACRYRA